MIDRQFALEAEQSVIGSVLAKPYDIMPELIGTLDEEDFSHPELRAMYRYCCGYFVDGKAIDHVILLAQMGDEYRELIAACVGMVPSLSNWRSYARIVRENAKRSRAIEAADELRISLDSTVSLGECAAEAEVILSALSLDKGDDSVSAGEGYYQFYASLQHTPEYLLTGFEHFDKYLALERGDYAVVGARPSQGKTALTLQMMLQMARKHRCAYFTLETSPSKIFSRLAACYTATPLWAIKRRDKYDAEKLSAAAQDFSRLNFEVVKAAGWSSQKIRAKAIQLGAEVIFVDYLGLVQGEGRSLYEKVTSVSMELHTMAQQQGITVVALCQLNRSGAGQPTMEHLRESGQIEQDADVIILIHDPSPDNQDIGPVRTKDIIIAKNKEGMTGVTQLHFNGEIQRFSTPALYTE